MAASVSPDLSRLLTPAPDLAEYELDDDLVVYHPASGQGELLNPTAAHIWELCDGSMTLGEVAHEIALVYQIEDAQAQADVAELVDQLDTLGFLVNPDLTAEQLRAKTAAANERARAAGLAVRESRLQRNGLPAGRVAPDFTLPDLEGGERSLRDFRGRRVLLVFSDTGCGPCQALAPQLVQLQAERGGDDFTVLMVSRGSLEANREKAAEHGYAFPVLLQKSWEVSKEYAIFATPVGYLISPDGLLASGVAIGAEAVLGLL